MPPFSSPKKMRLFTWLVLLFVLYVQCDIDSAYSGSDTFSGSDSFTDSDSDSDIFPMVQHYIGLKAGQSHVLFAVANSNVDVRKVAEDIQVYVNSLGGLHPENVVYSKVKYIIGNVSNDDHHGIAVWIVSFPQWHRIKTFLDTISGIHTLKHPLLKIERYRSGLQALAYLPWTQVSIITRTLHSR